MKKKPDPPMRDHYDFTGGVRGKHISRLAAGSNVVVLDPDLVEQFPDSKAVNNALRELLEAKAS